MAHSFRESALSVNAANDARCALLNDGYLRLYSGAQPSSADDPITTQVLLAELRFGTPAFGASVDGLATANAITSDPAANATGTAAFWRALMADGTTVVCDGSIGTSASDMNVNTVAVVVNTDVSIPGFTITQPEA